MRNPAIRKSEVPQILNQSRANFAKTPPIKPETL